MIKLGFGTTVIEKGLARGHIDGIGVYAKNLWDTFKTIEEGKAFESCAISFGDSDSGGKSEKLLGSITRLTPNYPIQSVASLLTGLPFKGTQKLEKNIDLFFAPDHHIPKLKQRPVVATIMDAYPLIYPKLVSRRLRSFKNMAFKRASHWADHIITISEYSKNDIAHYFELPEERISVIPLGVNRAFFERVPEESKESVRKKYHLGKNFFLFIGTIQPRKNLAKLIEAYTSLPLSFRRQFPLVIIGQYGWGEEDLKKRLRAGSEKEHIYWLEYVSDSELLALLQSALALVYPSLYEGFGLPLLEGFASQVPVIASSTTSIPEVGADAVRYIDPCSSGDIAMKLKELAEDQSLRETLIQKGLQRVKRYSWEKSAEEHLKLFKKLL